MARAYVEQTELPWPLLIDPERSAYDSYGFGRGSAWAIYGPASILVRILSGNPAELNDFQATCRDNRGQSMKSGGLQTRRFKRHK